MSPQSVKIGNFQSFQSELVGVSIMVWLGVEGCVLILEKTKISLMFWPYFCGTKGHALRVSIWFPSVNLNGMLLFHGS